MPEQLDDYERIEAAVMKALGKQMQAWGADPVAHVNAWNHYVTNAASSPLITLQLESEPLPVLKKDFDSLPHPSGDTPSNEDIQDHMLKRHEKYGENVNLEESELAKFNAVAKYIKESLDRTAFRAAIDELRLQNKKHVMGF